MRMIGPSRTALATLGAVLVLSSAMGTSVMAEPAQRAQEAAFARMLADPGNPALMIEHARAAAAARDYEGAVGTLERLLDIDPANQQARLDLARAYAALGSNAPAQYHLDLYRSRGDLTETERAEAERLAARLTRLDKPFFVTGSYQLGVAHRTEDGSTGLSYGLTLVARHDLGGAITHRWDTDLRLRGFAFGEEEDNRARFVLRTGPSFALDGTALGPRLRPFIGIETVIDEDLADEGTAGTIGLAYDNPVSRQVGVFASLEAGRLWREDEDDSDRWRALIGMTWRPSADLSLRVSARRTEESTDEDTLTRDSGRLDVAYQFDPGLFETAAPWVVGAFGQTDHEEFSNGRDDDLLSYGVRLRTFWTRDVFTELSASRLERNSNENSFDDEENILSLTVGRTF